jgi:hypothetical protein
MNPALPATTPDLTAHLALLRRRRAHPAALHGKRAVTLVAATCVLDHLFTVVAGPEGLLAPFGPVHFATLALGFAVLALRLLVTFVLVPLTVWRVTRPAAD